jgi:23S rRNA (pseudouridine1915-N3)-methyltransferase
MSKLRILAVTEGKEAWLNIATEVYSKKLKHFCDFEMVAIKPYKEARSQVSEKIVKESESILKKIDTKDVVFLCDLRGKQLSSLQLSQQLEKATVAHSSKPLVFVIGGAYGVDEGLLARAQYKIKFSEMTLNHHVAMVLLLEQLYRAFTIQKKIPYHNE